MSSLTTSTGRTRRRRPATARPPWVWALGVLVLAGAVALVFLTVFAGSSTKLADGVRIAGIDVGGLTPKQARRLLERRFQDVERTPIAFSAGGRTYSLMAVQLGIQPDFAEAVEAARREGDGFGPLRGYRRLKVRLADQDLQPRVRVWDQAVSIKLDEIAQKVDRPAREAALVRSGLKISVVDGHSGQVLDEQAAGHVVVASLAGFDRSPVTLPVKTAEPTVQTSQLLPALRRARTAISAPVRLVVGATAYRLPRWRVAQLLELPADGRTALRIGGPAADAYFGQLAHAVETKPKDATFAVDGPHVRIVPSQPGIGLDVPASVDAILAAATSPGPREARLSVAETQPERTTADAQKMGIVGMVSSYETFYGGVPNRLHNVQLVAHLVDNHLIAPGQEFSFNKTTGERSAAKGFLAAPVIVNGEVQTGLGGGVCQVSTTVFNAAFEAGLSITARTNHALYISHYPLGRDATVDYPNVDLKFMNDTGHWLLLRTFVGTGSLVVSLYGTPVHRKVEVETAPLRVVAQPPVQKVKDPTLAKGETVVESYGAPSETTSVHRKVFAPSGKLLYDTTWVSNYVSEPKVVRVGVKRQPPPTTTATTPQKQSPKPTTTAPASGATT